jgi:hypothetical protein
VSELSAPLRKLLRAFRGRRPDDVAWAPLRKPLAECRLALVASSICLVHGDADEYPGVKVGDPVLREIDNDDAGDLLARSRGRAVDGAANLERNVGVALVGLRGAVADGRLGELNRRHLALCGPMAATRVVVGKTVPRAAELLTVDRVDVALLVPT